MPELTMSCDEARRQMGSYLAGESHAALTAHLADCEACRQALIESALTERPAVTVPPRFAARVAAMVPADPPERAWAPSAIPILFVVLGIIFWLRGDGPAVAQALFRWQLLVAVFVLEAGIVIAWTVRTMARDE